MNIEPFVKKRAIFTGAVMLPLLMIAQYYGYDSMILTATIAGITGGLSVILFPDPNRQHLTESDTNQNSSRQEKL